MRLTLTLVFDGECALCARVAAAAHEMSKGELQVRPASDPRVSALRGTHDRPNRPLLLRETAGHTTITSGWRMRLTLLRTLGTRNALALRRMVAKTPVRGGVTRKLFLKRAGVSAAGLVSVTTLALPGTASALKESCRHVHCNAWRAIDCVGTNCFFNHRQNTLIEQRTCFGPKGGFCRREYRHYYCCGVLT